MILRQEGEVGAVVLGVLFCLMYKASEGIDKSHSLGFTPAYDNSMRGGRPQALYHCGQA